MLEANTATRSRGGREGGLTRREREVLAHVERGLTNLEIARRMRIAGPTVGRLLSNAMDRLGAESRVHAVILAGAPGDVAPGQAEEHTPASVDPEARALISRLAAGATLGQAAKAVHMSRRTADRRLAQARRALGVERTVVAIAWAHRLGWLD